MPVTTVSDWRGMEREMFLRLWVRAPRTVIWLIGMVSRPVARDPWERPHRAPRKGASTPVEPIRIARDTAGGKPPLCPRLLEKRAGVKPAPTQFELLVVDGSAP